MKKHHLLCLAAVACLTPLFFTSQARAASAAEYLVNFSGMQLFASVNVFAHDECVKQGFIKDKGPSAASRLQASIGKLKSTPPGPTVPPDVTSEQIAETAQKAFDMAQQKLQQNPLPVSQQKCDTLMKGWPQFAQQYGLQ